MKTILVAGAALLSGAAAGADVRVSIDFAKPTGPVKALHGVNNAPIRLLDAETAKVWEYEEAGIPYMRTHDTGGMWGGAHYVDIPNVFPDFDADENDPKSYDFAFTDALLKSVARAGTKIYYRLGVTIENFWRVKAYNIDPPKDFAKWARVCEHVVRHYNEGWADGCRLGIEYFEIWNEPENPPMWRGTREQFFELYRVTANHLKRCFPDVKVGGYGSCGLYAATDPNAAKSDFTRSFVDWFEAFCRFVTDEKTKAPLDFFSWHVYLRDSPKIISEHASYVRKALDAAGLTATESHLNEWNYVGPSWDDFVSMAEAKGAAIFADAFCRMQKGSVDKAMYYDGQPKSSYCGLFRLHARKREFRTVAYFAFKLWNELYKLGESVASASPCDDLAVAAARSEDGARAVLLVNDADIPRRVVLEGLGEGPYELRLLDDTHGCERPLPWQADAAIELAPRMLALLETPGRYAKPAARKAERTVFAGQDASASAP